MLHQCYYPSCVGQTSSWVLSPFAYNTLLAYLEPSSKKPNKYSVTYNILSNKSKVCIVKNKLFYSSSNLETSDNNLEKSELDFKKSNEAGSVISQWANQEVFKQFNIAKHISTNTTNCLVNLCLLKSGWQATSSRGRTMKVHNSFAYTQDVNYEPRILELPLEDEDFKFVVLVPTETDLLHTLFRRLTNEGLAASFASVQPIFTAPCALKPPSIDITSETNVKVGEDNNNADNKVMQYGTVKVDGSGVDINVLTCLYLSNERIISKFDTKPPEKSPFFFAIVFNDTALFTGQYTEENL